MNPDIKKGSAVRILKYHGDYSTSLIGGTGLVLEVAKEHLRVYMYDPVHSIPAGNWNHIINVGHEDVERVPSRSYFMDGMSFFLLGDVVKHIKQYVPMTHTVAVKERGSTYITVVIRDEDGKEVDKKTIQVASKR